MMQNWSTLFLLIVSRLISPIDCQEDILSQDRPCDVTEKASLDIKPCQFPFIYQDETYYGCTSNHDEDQLPWCSTQIDPITNEHVDKSGYWGHCPDTCPTEREGQEAENLLLSLTLKPGSLDTRRTSFSPGCSSSCRLYSSCQWSRDAVRSVSRLPRVHPVRQSLINFIRRRVCNVKEQTVFCCQTGDAPDDVVSTSNTNLQDCQAWRIAIQCSAGLYFESSGWQSKFYLLSLRRIRVEQVVCIDCSTLPF